MANVIGQALIEVVAAGHNFEKSVQEETKGGFTAVEKEASDSGSRIGQNLKGHFSSAFSGIGTIAKVGLATGVGAALGGLTAVFHTGLGEVEDYQTGLAQLQQGLKTTHNAAGTTAQGMEDLASKIQDYSGQTDDSVVSAEQLLLTFTNIRNEAGKGNDVFNQTTKIAADMAARLGGDASTSAIQLGKALNDPVKGISALQRVGVSFDEGQKKQIATMVQAGNTMGAQKVILKELNKEFGGSAEAVGKTLPGQIAIAKRHFEDFSQSVVGAVLPALFKVGGFISDILSPVFKEVGGWLYYVQEAFDAVVVGFQNRGPLDAATGIFRDIETYVGMLVTVFTDHLLPAARQIFGFFQANILPIFQALAHFIIGTLAPALAKILGAALDGLRAAFAHISQVIDAHRQQLTTLFNVLKTVAGFIVSTLAPVVGFILKNAFKVLGDTISVIITVISDLVTAVHKVADFFTGPFLRAIGSLVSVTVKGFKYIADVWLTVVGTIIDGAAAALGWVPGLGGKLKSAANAFDTFRTAVDAKLSAIASDASGWGHKAGTDMGAALMTSLTSQLHPVTVEAKIAVSQTAKHVRLDQLSGARASGGPVSPDRPYLVGEIGPELFVPDQAGTIVPSNRLGASGSSSFTIERGAFQVIIQGSADQNMVEAAMDQWSQGFEQNLRRRGLVPA